MKHSMVTFRLHRTAVIFIIIGSLLAALLIFAAGYVLAMRRRPVVAAVPAVAASAPAPPVAAAQPAPKVEMLAVRVGIFDSEDDAKTLAQQLAARKLDAVVVPLTTSGGVKLFTVEVGQYLTRAAAAAAASALADDEHLQGAVVPSGR
ncbi:MAG: SPOR domain-containing protein [Acidobacteria bacterium]|nr:SPOR domain-containing protein [Acidobacteriota bacterium]MBV9068569.1 SPOR domain-containing protein [Acidobacteriota bacterium]MBV9186717.1 SPOR domain-containing protein [Acidobacteriota bacterium]